MAATYPVPGRYVTPFNRLVGPIVMSQTRIAATNCSKVVNKDVQARCAPLHQQPEVNYLPRFSPLLICLERSPLRGDRSRQIDLFENLDIVHIRLLVARNLLSLSRSKGS